MPIKLGLSVNWSDRYVGATEVFQRGRFFRATGKNWTKKEEVEFWDRIIKQEFGPRWRLPTLEEVKELQQKCTIERAFFVRKISENKIDRTQGFRVKGPNGHILFMLSHPAMLRLPDHRVDRLCGPAFWSLEDGKIEIPYEIKFQKRPSWAQYSYNLEATISENYYQEDAPGVLIRLVTDEPPTGKEVLTRMFGSQWDPDTCIEVVSGDQKMEYDYSLRLEPSPDEKLYAHDSRERAESRWRERMAAEQEKEREKKERERRERNARIRRNRPSNNYDTGSVVDMSKSDPEGRNTLRTSSTTTYGKIVLQNRHIYEIEHYVNPFFNHNETWSGQCWNPRISLPVKETLGELIRVLERRDFEWCLDYYDAYGQLPD